MDGIFTFFKIKSNIQPIAETPNIKNTNGSAKSADKRTQLLQQQKNEEEKYF